MARWARKVTGALGRFVPLELADIPQPYKGHVRTQFLLDGSEFDVSFEISDYLEPNWEAVRSTFLTFKLQYADAGYADDRIVPGGYVHLDDLMYRMLPYLRWIRRRGAAQWDVNARFGSEFAKTVRARAMDRLAERRDWRVAGEGRKVRYSRYLRDVAASTVCVDLPGNGPFCFRLVEYLALGSCIVAVRHRARLPEPLRDGVHVVFVRDDLEDLVERCEELLRDEEGRKRLQRNALEYFDRYLHREQLAAYYLNTFLQRVP
jgi:hypothetical protein